MERAFLVGRVVVGAYYLHAAFGHFGRIEARAAHVASRDVPLPEAAVVITGLLLGVAGLCFLLGVYPKIGVAALVLFFVPTSFIMHAFWLEADPLRRRMEMVNFTKNMALLGSALMFLGVPEPWPRSVRLRGLRPARAAT